MITQHTMTIHHDKPVGVDCFFREIFPGDIVRDADGKEYTIDERGWARPMDGSTGCGFKKLKDPSFVSKGETPDTRFHEDASGKVAPALKVEVSGPEGDVPTKEEIAAEPAPGVRRTGGRANRSGVVQIETIARKVGAKGTAGLAAYLRDHDIEVTFIPNRNKQTIRIEDRDRAMELTKAWAAERAGMLGAMWDEPEPFPQLSQKALDAIKEGSLAKHLEFRPRIEGFSDTDLADELRRRGYTVTAIKHIEL